MPVIQIMSLNQYMPAGRTSLIKQGELDLQLQTEYAYRPRPRITTTISISGRVVQKIERELDRPVESEEQQAKVQRTIVRQHAEVISLIEKRVASKKASLKLPDKLPKHDPRIVPDKQPATEQPTGREAVYRNIPEQLMNLPGVSQIFRLTNDGDFVDDGTESKFRKKYRKIFKNLADLMELYGREQGGVKRMVGVYEVQPEKLYFASSGVECYFIVIEDASLELNYEIAIRDIVTGQ